MGRLKMAGDIGAEIVKLEQMVKGLPARDILPRGTTRDEDRPGEEAAGEEVK
jgi:hypothetical protein